MNILHRIIPFSPYIIKELEKSSLLLEKKYTALIKKEEENKKLTLQLKKTNINLKKELKEKGKELKELYNQTTIREDKKHRAKIRSIEKEIAGGFAHKIRNLYEPVILLNDRINRNDMSGENKKKLLQIFNLLKKKLPQSQFLKMIPVVEKINKNQKRMDEILDMSNNAIKKIITIINDFLVYSDIKKSKTMVDIDGIINSIINTHKKILSLHSINIHKKLKYIKSIPGDYELFYMVIQNLLLNAVRALQQKKTKAQKNKITISTYTANRNIYLEITDNGIGIPEENRDKIFEPFFTTDRREGTGLGLAFCKKIAELYNGSISVTNCDKGATFLITLPCEGEL